jgi:hypothetical protein
MAIAGLSTATYSTLSTAQISGLVREDLDIMGAGVATLQTSQIVAISPSSLEYFSTFDFANLVTTQIHAITASQVASLDTDGNLGVLPALFATGIQSFSDSAVGGFGANQIRALTPSQIGALKTSQIQSLGVEGLPGLTAGQALSLAPDQVASITSAQIGSR